MADADELLRAGDLDGARASLVEAVRKGPQDQQARMFLFQLLCIGGEWDKALTQLRALAQISPEAQMLSVAYGQAIEAEKVRAQVFAGASPPALLVSSSSTWAGDLTGALAALCQGRTEDAEALRDKAFEAAPETPGDLNGAAFDWIADGDARFGPALEAIIAGQWGLLPFDAVEKIQSEGPRDLRDIVWLPAQVFFKTGQSVAALLPARYPGSETATDTSLRLTRGTDWVDQPWGQAGVGQHEWSLSDGSDVGILSLRRLTFALMAASRLNPTLFDKLVADLEIDGLRESDDRRMKDIGGSVMRFYTVPRIERFNEAALRTTVRRELDCLLNTTNLGAVEDLDPYPQVKTSVLNYGVPDLAGKTLTKRVIQARAREIRDSVRAFEPRLDAKRLEVEAIEEIEKENAITYIIRGDVTSAVQAMPVEFKTDIEVDTASVTVRE